MTCRPCRHAASQLTATSANTWRCVCGARFERMPMALYDDLRRQAAAIDRWSAIMRTSTSARKFALTGRTS